MTVAWRCREANTVAPSAWSCAESLWDGRVALGSAEKGWEAGRKRTRDLGDSVLSGSEGRAGSWVLP